MKRVVIYGILCLLGFAAVPHGELGAQTVRGAEREMPRLTVKTNALYWATASFNAGLEVGLDRRITLEVTGGYNPWTYADNRKFKFWMVQPEVRFWPYRRFSGHFIGANFIYSDFNAGGIEWLGMGTRRYEGSLFGVGLSYGYMWSIGKRWHVEATIGVGYVSLEYDEYVWKQCGRFLGHGWNSYLGPTKIGVSFSYTIM